jgi:1-deoxy-D-xylulose-5-phosphate reductoisomerase
MSGLSILGATGTIGVNTLDVVSRNPQAYEVIALTAHKNVAAMAEQCIEWRPRLAVMADEASASQLRDHLRSAAPEVEVDAGVVGLERAASHPDAAQVVAGIVGGAGLLPTLAAARAGKRVLLANKEALVMSGDLFMQAIRDHQATLLPVDSEHNAIFQSLPVSGQAGAGSGVRKILLTGSGGPFRTRTVASLWNVTPDEACAHPNWVMGRKISVDSATMVNKGLEVIEACWLFDVPVETIEVVVHPQSIIHSMVEYVDGSILAELGQPDMRTPIAQALAWPGRIESGVDGLDFPSLSALEFEKPNFSRFPALALCIEAARAGGNASTILNAANEIGVQAFLDGALRFPDIANVIESGLKHASANAPASIDEVLEIDAMARQRAQEALASLKATNV